MAWCSEGPGPSPRLEGGIGFGRPEWDFREILRRGDLVEQQIVQAAAMLARTAPEAWEKFVEALHARAAEANDYLVASDANSLQLNQGRAQAYGLIFKTCRDAVNKQQEIERRMQNG